jgi:hypothetical protein
LGEVLIADGTLPVVAGPVGPVGAELMAMGTVPVFAVPAGAAGASETSVANFFGAPTGSFAGSSDTMD